MDLSGDDCPGQEQGSRVDVSLVHAQALSVEQLRAVLLSRGIYQAAHLGDKVGNERQRPTLLFLLCVSFLPPAMPSLVSVSVSASQSQTQSLSPSQSPSQSPSLSLTLCRALSHRSPASQEALVSLYEGYLAPRPQRPPRARRRRRRQGKRTRCGRCTAPAGRLASGPGRSTVALTTAAAFHPPSRPSRCPHDLRLSFIQ